MSEHTEALQRALAEVWSGAEMIDAECVEDHLADAGFRVACDRCKRMHDGFTCEGPAEKVCVTLPAGVHARMVEAVPWGERSGWIARLIEKELAS